MRHNDGDHIAMDLGSKVGLLMPRVSEAL